MNGLTFITDETHKRRYVQIDLADLAEINEEQLEELMDVLVAEARRNNERIPLHDLESELKAEGLL